MRKTFTLLLALVATVSMMAEPFFVRVNGTTDYAATATGEKDYQDRDQYAAKGIALAEGDLLTCFDQGSNAEWNIAAIDPYGAYENFSKEATALKCNVAGIGVIFQWSIAVGLSYVIGIPLGYGLVGMWIGFALDENIRGIILVRRWRSGKWRSKGFVKDAR